MLRTKKGRKTGLRSIGVAGKAFGFTSKELKIGYSVTEFIIKIGIWYSYLINLLEVELVGEKRQ